MKVNELIDSFEIYKTNEEKAMLERISTDPHPLSSYSEREQVIINSMIRKSLVSKVHNNGLFLVMRND